MSFFKNILKFSKILMPCKSLIYKENRFRFVGMYLDGCGRFGLVRQLVRSYGLSSNLMKIVKKYNYLVKNA